MNPELEIKMTKAFEQVLVDLGHGIPLNLSMIGDIFGEDFWKLIVLCCANVDFNANENKIVINVQLPK